jgi:hypothetical protein
MAKATKPKRESDQIHAFRKAARELGADENEERFKDVLRRVAKHKPPQEAKKK